jgi:hypothetical protein
VTSQDLARLLATPLELSGAAGQHLSALVRQVEQVALSDPAAVSYRPGAIL